MRADQIEVSLSPRKTELLTDLHERWSDGLITMSEYVFEAKSLGYTIIGSGEFLNDKIKDYESRIIEDRTLQTNGEVLQELVKLTEKFTFKVPIKG